MNPVFIFTLKACRKIYSKITKQPLYRLSGESDPNKAAKIIFEFLSHDKPCMIARFGSTELNLMTNYLGIKNIKNKSVIGFIKSEIPEWWWEPLKLQQLHTHSGFFPNEIKKNIQFCELMISDIKLVDVLGSWRPEERFFKNDMAASLVHLRFLEPFWSETPWTKVLKDKKVLVVHPFEKSIYKQYKNRKNLFKNPDVLPDFKSLTVIKAVQSLGEADDRFKDWFEALDYMKNEIDKLDYDVCLIGAGAYGFHLAAHVKQKGKKGIHIGGALQLLFGIRGKRWEDPNYGVNAWAIPKGFYLSMMNEHWIRPLEDETPKNANSVEGACYW
jgi:hypothetical protein